LVDAAPFVPQLDEGQWLERGQNVPGIADLGQVHFAAEYPVSELDGKNEVALGIPCPEPFGAIPAFVELSAAGNEEVHVDSLQADSQGVEEWRLVRTFELLQRETELGAVAISPLVALALGCLDLNAGNLFALVVEGEHIGTHVHLGRG